MVWLSLKTSVQKLERHGCRKKLQKKGQEVGTTLWFNKHTCKGVSTSSSKIFWVKEPNWELELQLAGYTKLWRSSVNAGSPPDFSAYLYMARTHKIKQMKTPLYTMENVNRLLGYFFSVILIFLSTTFCKKAIISRNSGCIHQSMTLGPISGKMDLTT